MSVFNYCPDRIFLFIIIHSVRLFEHQVLRKPRKIVAYRQQISPFQNKRETYKNPFGQKFTLIKTFKIREIIGYILRFEGVPILLITHYPREKNETFLKTLFSESLKNFRQITYLAIFKQNLKRKSIKGLCHDAIYQIIARSFFHCFYTLMKTRRNTRITQ